MGRQSRPERAKVQVGSLQISIGGGEEEGYVHGQARRSEWCSRVFRVYTDVNDLAILALQ